MYLLYYGRILSRRTLQCFYFIPLIIILGQRVCSIFNRTFMPQQNRTHKWEGERDESGIFFTHILRIDKDKVDQL